MDIKLSCHGCGQHVIVDSSAGGATVNCPSCGAELILPEVLASSGAQTPPLILRPSPTPNSVPSSETLQPPIYVQSPQQTQKNIAWGVFKGLFGFFILLPLGVLVLVIGIGTCVYDTQPSKDSKIQTFKNRSPTQSEFDAVKILSEGFSWKLLQAKDATFIEVNCPINNPTQSKLLHLRLQVQCSDNSGRLIGTLDKTTQSDEGMDFIPPLAIKHCEFLIPLGSIAPGSIDKVSVAIKDFQCSTMTDIDKRLCELKAVMEGFYNSDRITMTLHEKQAEEEFLKLVEIKK